MDDNGSISIRRLGPRGWSHVTTAQREEILGVQVVENKGTSRLILCLRDGSTVALEPTFSKDDGRRQTLGKFQAFFQ